MEEKNVINIPAKFLNREPLTLQEIKESAEERISLISKEFTEGFDFLKRYPKSVTFFGSARFDDRNKYYTQAQSLAERISKELGYAILTGGGPGIMEAANRGAYEANGESLGLNIKLPKEQVENSYLTDSLGMYYFFVRKVCLNFAAESYIAFPGGFGTMDELFGLITLMQTHKAPRAPIFLVGSDFWNPVMESVTKLMIENKSIDKADLELFRITDDEEEIIDSIKKAPVRNGLRYHYDKVAD